MNLFSYGAEALLVEVGSPDEAAALRAQLTASPPPGTTETAPGLRTVLIRFDPRATDAGVLARQLTDLADGAPPQNAGTRQQDDEAVLVRVSYDGDDLDDVAAHTGLTVDAVIAAHQARAYRVTLIGMAPGFYFLSGGDPRLEVPRLAVSAPAGPARRGRPGRPADRHLPQAGPRRLAADRPGARRPMAPHPAARRVARARGSRAVHRRQQMIEILEARPGTSVQDLGRTGYAAWGIAPSGAADRASLRLANRLVGNAEDAAVIEVLLGGLTIRATIGALIAVTGAPAAVLLDRTRAGRRDGPQWVPCATLSLASPPEQLRSYVAVRGGLDTAEVLGSRSVDESSGIGRGLRPGDVLKVGSRTVGPPLIDQAPRAGSPAGPWNCTALPDRETTGSRPIPLPRSPPGPTP